MQVGSARGAAREEGRKLVSGLVALLILFRAIQGGWSG